MRFDMLGTGRDERRNCVLPLLRMRLRLRRNAAPTKLDRRRQRSRDEHNESTERHRAFRALTGPPSQWPPGVEGERRQWGGSDWIFQTMRNRGAIVFTGWFRDVA